jgi:Domain of unknown function (DUF3291)
MDYRLVHFNCARPMGKFDFSNEFVQVFVALLPRIFKDGDAFEGLLHHDHGLRCPDGSWRGFTNAFPYPPEWRAPDISTLAVWRSLEDLKAFSHNGRTHPPGMRRLAQEIDRSNGPGFVMWWAAKGERFTLEDGWQRLQHLRQHGSTDYAFSLDQPVKRPAVA